MDLLVLFFLLVALSAVYIWIGQYTANDSTNNEEYFLANRSFGVFALTTTLLATQLGAGALTGVADEAFHRGWSVIFYPLGMFLGLMGLGLGIGSLLTKSGMNTTAEIFEKYFGSPKLRQFAGLVSVATLFFILIGQGIAAKKFFAAAGLGQTWIIMGFWLVVIFYTVVGGLKAVVYTDAVQVFVILLVLAASLFFVSTNPFTAEISWLDMAPENAAATSIPWIDWMLMPFLFMCFEQDMGQRCFAAKSSKTISISAILSALLLFAVNIYAIYMGILAKKAGLSPDHTNGILMHAIQQFTSPVFSAFFGCAILMAVLSTADSLLCSIASNVVFDFPYIKSLAKKKQVLLSRLITFVVGFLAMALSLMSDNVVSMLIFSYELSVSALFVPTAFALFTNKHSKTGAICAISMGSASFLLLKFVFFISSGGILITLFGSVAAYFLGYLFEEKKQSAQVQTNS